MEKLIEVVDTDSNTSKLTIAADRVTVKCGKDDVDRDFLAALAGRCANVVLPQTGRAKITVKDVEWGSVPLYTQDRRGNKRVLGRLYFNEEPVRFEATKDILL